MHRGGFGAQLVEAAMANPDGDHSYRDTGRTGEFMMLDKAIYKIRREE